MAPIIQTRGLTKHYRKLVALDSIDLVVEEGAVYGFVGPNGAGKTTTMRILATLLTATQGEAWVGGYSVQTDPQEVRRIIGYMPDFFGVYGDMRTGEMLDFFAACYDIPAHKRVTLVNDLLDLIDLSHRRDDYVDNLSRGMKQRLCLARALAHDPQILILDEPASGLDPRARIEMRELLRELHNMGKTIIVSSHILTEIEDVCTHIGIIEGGRIVASGTLEEMRLLIGTHRIVRIGLLKSDQETLDATKGWLLDQPSVLEAAVKPGNNGIHMEITFAGDEQALADLLAAMITAGIPVIMFREEPSDLEDVFMRLTQGIVS